LTAKTDKKKMVAENLEVEERNSLFHQMIFSDRSRLEIFNVFQNGVAIYT
jgi:hypothetical protein